MAPSPAVGLQKVDAWQRRNRPAAIAFAVIKKYGDDRGGSLAGLITFYAFLSLFPLLLLAVTVLGYLLAGDPGMRDRLVHGALGQLPLVGDQIGQQVHGLTGQPVGIAVGIVGLVLGAMGVAEISQFAMQQIWALPANVRPGFFPRLARDGMFLSVVAVSAVAGSFLGSAGGRWWWLRVIALVGSAAINIGAFVLAFRILTAGPTGTRALVPGALIAGAGWTALQGAGGYLVGHQLRHMSQVYGTFAVVLGLLSFLSLGARLTVYAAELNVVLSRQLWPRSLITPPLTDSDRQVFVDLARQEARTPGERVQVTFDPPVPGAPTGAGAPAGAAGATAGAAGATAGAAGATAPAKAP